VSKPPVVAVEMSPSDWTRFNRAIQLMAQAFDDVPVAFVMKDEDQDLHIMFRPGHERAAAHAMSQINWRNVMRVVEEHLS